MAVLAISHNIYLNEEQRYALHRRETVSVIGISYPVWFCEGKVEETTEIYVKYNLTNIPGLSRVHIVGDAYCVNLPQFTTSTEKIEIEDVKIPCDPINSKRLLNFKDDGSGVLTFQVEDVFKIEGEMYKATHFVDIKDRSYFFDNCLTLQKLGRIITSGKT